MLVINVRKNEEEWYQQFEMDETWHGFNHDVLLAEHLKELFGMEEPCTLLLD